MNLSSWLGNKTVAFRFILLVLGVFLWCFLQGGVAGAALLDGNARLITVLGGGKNPLIQGTVATAAHRSEIDSGEPFFVLADGSLLTFRADSKGEKQANAVKVNKLGHVQLLPGPWLGAKSGRKKIPIIAGGCGQQAGCFALGLFEREDIAKGEQCARLGRYNIETGEFSPIAGFTDPLNPKRGSCFGSVVYAGSMTSQETAVSTASLIVQDDKEGTDPVILFSFDGSVFRYNPDGSGAVIYKAQVLPGKQKEKSNSLLLAQRLSYSSDGIITAVVPTSTGWGGLDARLGVQKQKTFKAIVIHPEGTVQERTLSLPAPDRPLLYRLGGDGRYTVVATNAIYTCSPEGQCETYQLTNDHEHPNLAFSWTLSLQHKHIEPSDEPVAASAYNGDGETLDEFVANVKQRRPFVCAGKRGFMRDPQGNFDSFTGFAKDGAFFFTDSCSPTIRAFTPGSDTGSLPFPSANFANITNEDLAAKRLPVRVSERGMVRILVKKNVVPFYPMYGKKYPLLKKQRIPSQAKIPFEKAFSQDVEPGTSTIALPEKLSAGYYIVDLQFQSVAGGVASASRNLFVGLTPESLDPGYLARQIGAFFYTNPDVSDLMDPERYFDCSLPHGAKRRHNTVICEIGVDNGRTAEESDYPYHLITYSNRVYSRYEVVFAGPAGLTLQRLDKYSFVRKCKTVRRKVCKKPHRLRRSYDP